MCCAYVVNLACCARKCLELRALAPFSIINHDLTLKNILSYHKVKLPVCQGFVNRFFIFFNICQTCVCMLHAYDLTMGDLGGVGYNCIKLTKA